MVFKHLDRDDKTYLTKEDLKDAMEKMNYEICIDDIEYFIDKNEPVNKGKVTFDLFKRIMKEESLLSNQYE